MQFTHLIAKCREFLKKLREKFTSTMDQQKYESLMTSFKGQKFQWVKTDRIELIGKEVKCRNIQPVGNRFIVQFDDGSEIDSTRLNNCMQLITAETPLLTREEAMSLNPQRPPAVKSGAIPPGPIDIPKELQEHVTRSQSATCSPGGPHSHQVTYNQPPADKPNMFALFNSETTNISLNLSVKLPDRKLLKMMYQGADDKEKFLSELSEYLAVMINKEVVMASVTDMLVPPTAKPKKEKPPEIKITQVQ
jgi:hypothetical protein